MLHRLGDSDREAVRMRMPITVCRFSQPFRDSLGFVTHEPGLPAKAADGGTLNDSSPPARADATSPQVSRQAGIQTAKHPDRIGDPRIRYLAAEPLVGQTAGPSVTTFRNPSAIGSRA
ncbi:hypothetical protein K227x_38460 [Rubripirellula lacrimiformis]|uniref:Uncharacterized protein n=1 Tax=Rubripirellula lacrimiformis TaxID=1930273 RepID=A0A517NE92_9BACT|nr:hypothetical protein K227x_38460 [Rubripirellula lacrimiformis]